MQHSAQALILHCIDFRFVQETRNFMNNLGLKDDYDDVGAAGAAKNIVDPYDAHDVEFIMRQIEIAKKLHGITQVVIINHLDCGAYGKGTFATKEEERARHLRDLKKAKSTIEKRFEGLSVVLVLARIDSEGKVDFEKVA